MTATSYRGRREADVADASARVEAELAYQRALAALHEARADLAGVAAARRRLAYERAQLPPADADARDRELGVRFAELSTRATGLRDEAARLREDLRRHTDDATSEPAELPEGPEPRGFEEPGSEPRGFEQPPFQGWEP
jgi:hypothetical protein